MNSEASQKKRKINPRKNANLFSKITFWYTKSMFRNGLKREIEEEDLYDVLPEYDTCKLGDRIDSEWSVLKHKKRFAMFSVFWNMIGKFYFYLGFTKCITIFLNVIRPFIVGRLVFYFTPGQKDLSKLNACLYSLLLVAIYMVDVIYRNNYHFTVEALAIKFRTAICSLIYRKLLKLPTSHLRNVSFGNISNIVTRDINMFGDVFLNINETWVGLITTLIMCCYMYIHIGLPAVIVAVAFGILISVQVWVGIWIAKLKTSTCNKTDKRIEVLQESLRCMRSTKMYVWESHLKQNIEKSRQEEMNILFKMYTALFQSTVGSIVVYNVVFYLVLMTNIWLGQPMTAETVYFIVSGLLSLSFYFVTGIPYGIFYLSQFCAALKRMQILVQILEVQTTESPDKNETENPRIQMKNVAVEVTGKIIFENVNADISKGLTLVTGAVSSGKSLLLMTILKEFEVSQGSLTTEGRISYVSQEAWLFPSTIRQNIIFGSKYDEKRYQNVIKACALEYDFGQMENGDATIIVDGGINLSKGQQSRVSLARAIYKESDIYLLDDCFSSLDSLVARYIFDNCILKILRNKLVLLVTHNTNLKLYATNTLILGQSTIKLYRNELPPNENKMSFKNVAMTTIIHAEKLETEDDVIAEAKLISTPNKTNTVYGEEKKIGSVSLQIYKIYLQLGGGVHFSLIIFLAFVLTQVLISCKDKLISEWTNLEGQISQSHKSNFTKNLYLDLNGRRNQLLYKYTGAVIALSCMTLIRSYTLFIFAKRVSVKLHSKMLKSILRVSLQFFDRTFIGNIINRFSKDLITVDENIPFILNHLVVILFETVGSILLISSTNIKFIIPIALVFTSFIFLRCFYLRIGQPLKRLDVSTKSPVIGYFNATLEGLTSIKTFGAERIIREEFEKCHNLYNSASFCHLACIKAFVFVTDIVFSIFIGVIIFQFVIFDQGVLPGDVGLAISQAFVMGSVISFCTYKGVDLETQMTSVERAVEYTNIQTEAETGLELKNWPKNGEVEYKDVYLSLNDSRSYVLKNINIFIKPKEKIGVVGRSGAGKSSLISALFRLYETEGKIEIDGTDIRTLSLDFLRSSMSVIPQDLVLFNSTIRDNIDPGRLYEDEKIWKAIETVKLRKFVPNLEVAIKDLDFSCGQKQLICLARILVRKSKIVVLDEMVEIVDERTERLIYDIVDKHFSDHTVIKIAHKLNFVMTCDKILVLENGEMIEFDTPNALMKNKDGLFYRMVESFGCDLQNT